LKRNLPIYNNILYYGHNNFSLAILEDLGSTSTSTLTKKGMLLREQYYLNLLFNNYFALKLNCSSNAGSTLGFKHKPQFSLNRLGYLNPMTGKIFSQAEM
jgi:hypothetical protein